MEYDELRIYSFPEQSREFCHSVRRGRGWRRHRISGNSSAFIAAVSFFTPAIYYLRHTQGSRYASLLKLWNVWHDRIVAQALAPAMQGIQELIASAEKNKIKPIWFKITW
jgi:hypothetical protein